jgi:hypothetical protein
VHDYSFVRKRSTEVMDARVHHRQQKTASLNFFFDLWILQVGTGARCVEYSGDGCTSTTLLAIGFSSVSLCFLHVLHSPVKDMCQQDRVRR